MKKTVRRPLKVVAAFRRVDLNLRQQESLASLSFICSYDMAVETAA